MKKLKNKLDKYFLLSWRKLFLIVIAWIGSVILHNLIYAFIIGVLKIPIEDEAFFFIIATIVIPTYFVISVIYTAFNLFKKRKKK